MSKNILSIIILISIHSLCFCQEKKCDSICAIGSTINNKKYGAWLYYKKNMIYRISYFNNDTLNGKTTLFYENGGIKRQMNFINGDVFNYVYFYSRTGELIAIYEYSYGVFDYYIMGKFDPDMPPHGDSFDPIDDW